MFFTKLPWMYTNKNIAVTIFTEYGSRFGWTWDGTPIDLVFLSDGVNGGFEIYIFIYLISDLVWILTIMQSQSLLDISGHCTGVKFIFGRKFIYLFQDLLSLEFLIVYFEFTVWLIINGWYKQMCLECFNFECLYKEIQCF